LQWEASVTYQTYEDYRQDFEVASLGAKATHGNINQTKQVDPTVGWKLYQHAFKPALGFQTFGRHITGNKAKDLMEFRQKHPTAPLPKEMIGMNHGEKFFQNFGVVNESDSGSVLLMGGGKWNFTINDSWLLGGVNGLNDFYAASPLVKKNVLDDNYILSITGRELFGLAIFGYQMVTTSYGIGFTPGSKMSATNARLTDYQAAIGALKKPKDAANIFKKAGYKL
jgi:hypothetical protein